MKKYICGYEGRYTVDEDGAVYSEISGKELSKVVMDSGYVYVHLFDGKNKNGKCLRLNRIVAQTFLPNPNGFEQVNHKNGNKKDNSVNNLEWCSPLQNMQHAVKTGLKNHSGDKNPSAKLTWDQVHAIREEYKYNSNSRKIAAKYGITQVMVCKIARNECWVDRNYHPERSIHREQ